jgi:hypothetical protein
VLIDLVDSTGVTEVNGKYYVIFSAAGNDWQTVKTVSLYANNDEITEGIHYGRITHTVTSVDDRYNGININNVDIKIADDEEVTLLVLESGGDTRVAERGATAILQEGVVFKGSITDTFEGSFGIAEVGEKQGNDSIYSAQDLSLARWSLSFNPDINDSVNTAHITVNATGDGTQDYYQFTVTNEMLADNNGSVTLDVDIDGGYSDGDSIFWRSKITIMDKEGNILGSPVRGHDNDVTPDIDSGSTSNKDAILNDFQIADAGTYIIQIDRAYAFGILDGSDYQMHVSLEGKIAENFIFTPEAFIEDEAKSSTSEGQLIDPIGNGNWYTEYNALIGNTENNGNINSSTPYISVQGVGNGTFDSYRFTIEESMISPSVKTQTPANVHNSSNDNGPWYTNASVDFTAAMTEVGDQWSIVIDEASTITHTIVQGESIADIINDFISQIPVQYEPTLSGNSLLLSDEYGFKLDIFFNRSDDVQRELSYTNDQTLTASLSDPVELAFTGSPKVGEQWTLELANDSVTIDVVVGDLSATLTVLVAAINNDANTPFNANLNGNVIEITNQPYGAFTSGFYVIGADTDIDISIRGEGDIINEGNISWSTVDLTLSGNVNSGERWLISDNGVPIADYIVEDGINTLAELRDKLITNINDNLVYAATTGESANQLSLSYSAAFTASLVVTPVMTGDGSATKSELIITDQINDISLTGTVTAGDVWQLNIDGHTVNYVVKAADTGTAALATNLASEFTDLSLSGYSFNAILDVLTVERSASNTAISSTLRHFTPTVTGSITTTDDGSNQKIFTLSTPEAGNAVVAGELWSISLDGIDYNYTASDSDTLTTIAADLAGQLSTAGYNVDNNVVNVLKVMPVVISSATVLTGTGTTVDSTVNKQDFTITNTGTVAKDDIWTITVDTNDYTYKVLADNESADVIAAGLSLTLDNANIANALSASTLTVFYTTSITSITSTQSAADAVITTSAIDATNLQVTLSTTNIVAGEKWTITIDTIPYDYFVKSTDTSIADITTGLANSITGAIISGANSEIITVTYVTTASSSVQDNNSTITQASSGFSTSFTLSSDHVAKGEIWTINVNGTLYTYTVLADGESLDSIALILKELIDDNYGVSINNSTITLSPTVSETVAVHGLISVANKEFTLSSDKDEVKAGVIWTINVNGTNYSYKTQIGDTTLNQVAIALEALIANDVNGEAVNGSVLSWTSNDSADGAAVQLSTGDALGAESASTVSHYSYDLLLTGTPVLGEKWRITIDGESQELVITSAHVADLAQLADDLAAEFSGSIKYTVTSNNDSLVVVDKIDTNQITTITTTLSALSPDADIAFNGQLAEQWLQTIVLSDYSNQILTVEDRWAFTIAGKNYTPVGDSIQTVLADLHASLLSDGLNVGVYNNADEFITITANAAVVIAEIDYQKSFAFTKTDDVPGRHFDNYEIDITGNVVTGQLWAVNIDGVGYEYVVQQSDVYQSFSNGQWKNEKTDATKQAAVVNGLKALITADFFVANSAGNSLVIDNLNGAVVQLQEGNG